MLQKYLTFLANRSYFGQAGENAGKIFSHEFESTRTPTLTDLESFRTKAYGLEKTDMELESVITLESSNDLQAENDQAFMNAIMQSESHTSKTI